MADAKITELTELTSAADGDVLPIVDDPAGTPVTKKITVANLLAGATGSTDAADINIADSGGNFSATNVEDALAEVATGKQAADADLSTIAALAPSNDDILQRKAGAWANRTIAQLLTDLAAAGTTFQPLDADLTALAALTTTSYGRALLEVANEAALKALINLEIGTDVQAYDAELAALAGLTSAANKLPYFTGSGAAAVTDLTAAGRALLDDADAAAQRATLALGGLAWSTVAGTSFPGSPSAGDRFFRTDLGMEFFYDGTRWLSTQVFVLTWQITNNISGSQNTRMAIPYPNTSPDKWLMKAAMSFYVQGGTALSASHKWVLDVKKEGSGGATTLATFTIDSGSSDTWRTATPVDIDAAMGDTFAYINLLATKTGTPGNLMPMASLTYRLIGT